MFDQAIENVVRAGALLAQRESSIAEDHDELFWKVVRVQSAILTALVIEQDLERLIKLLDQTIVDVRQLGFDDVERELMAARGRALTTLALQPGQVGDAARARLAPIAEPGRGPWS